jgi:hypothetical protein
MFEKWFVEGIYVYILHHASKGESIYFAIASAIKTSYHSNQVFTRYDDYSLLSMC